MRSFEFTIVVDKNNDGSFTALCPALQGAFADAKTLDDAMDMITEAIKDHIERKLADE